MILLSRCIENKAATGTHVLAAALFFVFSYTLVINFGVYYDVYRKYLFKPLRSLNVVLLQELGWLLHPG